MDQEASDNENANDQPNYFCYKAYIKLASYAMFSLYSLVGIKRIYDHVNQFLILDRCRSCRLYEEQNAGLFWFIPELLLYGLAPLSALIALIHADLEWLFPTYAIRLLFPSFMLAVPILFTIFSYILYWFIDLIIDVQQVSDNLLDMIIWKRCIWAGALLITNIYAILLAIVVLQLIYYQHYIIIEQQVIHRQRNLINGIRVWYHRNIDQRRHQLINQPANDDILQNQARSNNNEADIEIFIFSMIKSTGRKKNKNCIMKIMISSVIYNFNIICHLLMTYNC
ncbi:ABC transporter G family member [Dirofilaria immitis]